MAELEENQWLSDMKTADTARSSEGRIAELQTALSELAASQVAMHCVGSLAILLRRRRQSTGIIGWLEVTESDLSTFLARNHRQQKRVLS